MIANRVTTSLSARIRYSIYGRGIGRTRRNHSVPWTRATTCSNINSRQSRTTTTTTTSATSFITTTTKRSFKSSSTVHIHEKDNKSHNTTRTCDDDPAAPWREYLSSLGYEDPLLQNGMADALKPVFGNPISIDQLKSFGTQGLDALSKSVQEQIKIHHDRNPNAFVGTVHIDIPHHNYSFDLRMNEHENFMTCATEGSGSELLGEYLECACGGNMSCSTCHIILDEETFAKLDPPCEAELDMLDLAYEPTDTSRLGCQIVMSRHIDGMTVTIPAGVNNLWG